MNMKERLRHVAKNISGKDWLINRAAICQAAKESGGTVLTASIEEAIHLQKSYGVPARYVESNLDDYHGPFFIDPWALESMLNKGALKIESLEVDVELLKLKVKHLESL